MLLASLLSPPLALGTKHMKICRFKIAVHFIGALLDTCYNTWVCF